MGEYIVDSYMDYGEYVFDYYPNLYSDLTLSCVDLSAYAEAEEALNDYFCGTGHFSGCAELPQTGA